MRILRRNFTSGNTGTGELLKNNSSRLHFKKNFERISMLRSALNGFFEATKQAIFSTIDLRFPVESPVPFLRLTAFFPG